MRVGASLAGHHFHAPEWQKARAHREHRRLSITFVCFPWFFFYPRMNVFWMFNGRLDWIGLDWIVH